MSFDLPRKAVSLRFTGEVKALEPEPKNPLGQTRPKAPPTNRSVPRTQPPTVPPPPATARNEIAPPAVPVRKPDLYTVEMQPTPFVGSRPSERAEAVAALLPAAIAAKSPEIRVQLTSISDDDHITEALDRGELGLPSVMRKGAEEAPPSAPAPKINPWSHVRSADQAPPPPERTAILAQKEKSASKGGPLSMTAWVLVAIMAGIVSYTFAPAAFSSLEKATGLVETR